MNIAAPRPLVALALSLCLLGVGAATVLAPAADARTYPSKIRSTFVDGCVKTAVKTARGELSRAEARRQCTALLKCMERRLTLSQFKQLDRALARGRSSPYEKVLRSCARQVLE